MNKKFKKKLNQSYLYRYASYIVKKKSVLKDPYKEANRVFKNVFKRDLNLESPKNLIEKITWLQFYSDTSLWTKYTDKYLVKDFVKESGYEDNIAKLYGKWDNANDIDFDKLPRSFVLKTNNGCGTVMIVKDKFKLNTRTTRRKLNKWLSIPYGYTSAQLHYTRIKPCIIAEELFVDEDNHETSLIDYKIWCIHGEPIWILVISNRFDKLEKESFSLYDLGWNNISEQFLYTNTKNHINKDIQKPKSLDKMLEMAKTLSKGFPQVRADFYDVSGKAYFGELTFATGFGSHPEVFYDYLGSKIDLELVDKVKKRNNETFK